MVLSLDTGAQMPVGETIPPGHKIALQSLGMGDEVRRYGQLIGFATTSIARGTHVHIHNLGIGNLAHDYAFGADVRAVQFVPEGERRTFMGYPRVDGRVGTRNFIAVIATVNCSAHTVREIARHFTPERLAAYPNVDGVIALTHTSGCPLRDDTLERVLAGMVRHPNVGGALLVGLGCETNQAGMLVAEYGLCDCVVENCGHSDCGRNLAFPHCPTTLVIQDLGGIRKTVAAGIAAVEALLPQVNAVARAPQPLSELMLALQCGGSDAWSGVTANPAVGLVSDAVVRQGGTVVLAETPEIHGAEHLLTRRAVSPEVGQKLLAQVAWWEAYAARMGVSLDNNRSVGNAAGGLSTIYEKSLGAIAKGGSTPLMGVYGYAEPVTARGLTFMNTPGYDTIGVTGQMAGGCNLVLFTTGRGSVVGSIPAPTIKICSNAITYARMEEDMDVNAGRVLEGATLEEVADELLDLVIAVASGRPSKSEALGTGEAEFAPWSVRGVL
ncbi:MAG: altronate dehydratase [Anaerolineae bacterium]|nr:altronate dehydratase [Anaerolineae bacterium]